MTFCNLVGLGNAEYLKVLEYAQENDRRRQDRELGLMPSEPRGFLAAEVSQAFQTDRTA